MNLPQSLWAVKSKELPEKYREAFTRWLDGWEAGNRQKGIYLFGPPEKTEPAFAVLMKAVRRRCTPAYCILASKVPDFLLRNPDMEDWEATRHLTDISMLGILGLGREHRDRDGFITSLFSKVLEDRFYFKRPIIVSSTIDPSDLAKVYSIAVSDFIKGSTATVRF